MLPVRKYGERERSQITQAHPHQAPHRILCQDYETDKSNLTEDGGEVQRQRGELDLHVAAFHCKNSGGAADLETALCLV